MLTVDEARARIRALARRLPSEHVDLVDARGRILRESVVAQNSIPERPLSLMDGYAVATSAFSTAAPHRLPVRHESRAGHVVRPLEPNTTMRIFTGAPLPDGADSVVMQENVVREESGGESVARFERAPAKGENLRSAGEDMQRGDVLLEEGDALTPARIALLAQCDRATVRVATRPRVAILATGDELRIPGSNAREGSIVEAASYLVRPLVEDAGGVVVERALVPDDLEATKRAIASLVGKVDVIVTIGGVSVGDHDLVKPALEALGATLDFWKVAMRPGKPLAFAKLEETLFLGLPGNPVSAFVTFMLFGLPLLKAMQTARVSDLVPERKALGVGYAHAVGRAEFPRARISPHDDTLVPVSRQASGSVRGLADADGIFFIPEQSPGFEAGALVEFYRFR